MKCRAVLMLGMLAALAPALAACGHQGKLKTPSEARADAEKKAAREAKKQAQAETNQGEMDSSQ